jgi:beta-1,4-mannosyltransferase
MRARGRVLVFPDWRGNAFQNLMSLAARAEGFEFLGADTVGQFARVAAALGTADVIHIHWTSPIAQDATSASAARKAVRTVVRSLERARRRGARVIWTVHNRLPHELDYRREEILLHEALAELSDVIHIMSLHTVEALSDVCKIPPSKVWLLPHPTYAGLYDTSLSRSEARARMNLGPSDKAVLLFGQIRPYKGTLRALRSLSILAQTDPQVVVLLAGRCVATQRDEILQALPESVNRRLHLDHVDEGDIPMWFMSADVALFPFTSILNSGSAHLAATFGTHVLLPKEPALEEVFRTYVGAQFFAPGITDSALAEEVEAALARSAAPRSAMRWGITPWEFSRRYRDELLSITTG